MDDPDAWRWVWLVAAFVFAGGEILTGGSFFLLPFSAGALVASLLAFLGVGVAIEVIAFLAVSALCLAALYPLRRRLDRAVPDQNGIGARRLLGEQAKVLVDVPGAHELGLVLVGREQWRAESLDGNPIPSGTSVKVVEVRGTRVVVFPADRTPPALDRPPSP